MTAILEESTRAANEAHKEFEKHVANCVEAQRKMLDQFIENFEYDIENGENYDQAIYSIVNFAKQAGIALQHVEFDDFSRTMTSKKTFRLE